MSSRLVVFLGDHDKKAHYIADGVPKSDAQQFLPWNVWQASAKSPSLAALPEIVVVGTRTTKEVWLSDKERLFTDLGDHAGHPNAFSHPVGFLLYDESLLLEPQGFWAFFESMRAILAGEPLGFDQPRGFEVYREDDATKAAFARPVNHLIVDITHGYRSIPFLSGAVIDFVQTARMNVRHEILYAVLEGNLGTVRDLSLYTTAGRLNRALDQFHRHGRADELAAFFEDERVAHVPACKALAGPMRAFAEDLLLLRLPSILQDSGPAIHRALASHFERLKMDFDPAASSLTTFKQSIDAIFQGGLPILPVSEEGLRATYQLAELLWTTGHYTELYCLLREAAVTRFALRRAPVGTVHLQPHEPGFERAIETDEARAKRIDDEEKGRKKKAEKEAKGDFGWRSHRRAQESSAREEIDNDTFFDIRNDVAHCSMRAEPKTPAELRDELAAELLRLRSS